MKDFSSTVGKSFQEIPDLFKFCERSVRLSNILAEALKVSILFVDPLKSKIKVESITCPG